MGGSEAVKVEDAKIVMEAARRASHQAWLDYQAAKVKYAAASERFEHAHAAWCVAMHEERQQ